MSTTYTIEQLNKHSKNELIEIILELQNSTLTMKQRILNLLAKRPHTITQLAESLGTTNKNVSSQLNLIRKDNILIFTNPYGYKFILNHDYPFDPLIYQDSSNQ